MDKEYVVHKHNGVLFSCKHESDSTTCSKMDATGGHYVERNKPETERKKKHALPYMWELNFKKKKNQKRNACVSQYYSKYSFVKLCCIPLSSQLLIMLYYYGFNDLVNTLKFTVCGLTGHLSI